MLKGLLVLVVLYLIYRWVTGYQQQSTLQQQWTPSVYSPQYGGGSLLLEPGIVSGYFTPAAWSPNRGFAFNANW